MDMAIFHFFPFFYEEYKIVKMWGLSDTHHESISKNKTLTYLCMCIDIKIPFLYKLIQYCIM